MKVFISYSHKDKEFALKLKNSLEENGIETWIDSFTIDLGDNIFQKIEAGLKECDYILALLSKNYLSSQWAIRELTAFEVRDVSTKSRVIIPVLLEDCDIPIFLRDKLYVDFRHSYNQGVETLIEGIKLDKTKNQIIKPPSIGEIKDNKESSERYHLNEVRKHFNKGELCLFCGAGISIGAGIPPWSILLRDLLTSLFGKKLTENESIETKIKLAEFYQNTFNPSPLMIAQYLKNGLGKDFLKSVSNSLYKRQPSKCDMIDAIVELCRPQRSREALHSIITFNFDDLIEINMKENRIEHFSVFNEGQRPPREAIPIYHVHGFLPREGDFDGSNEIVFSEDAYHSQFMDPFSWSNLVQLNHLSQQVCVFVGISMTDPNLRRLLDVAMRKNPDRIANHYYFKKRYNHKQIEDGMKNWTGTDNEAKSTTDIVKITEMLEEQDARNLGLNVIWVDEYEEIPKFLEEIIEK